jgi:thiosulfate reductase cytochrome b subunit
MDQAAAHSDGAPHDRRPLVRTREWSWIYRYSALVRVSHWVNVLCLAILAMSGLQIFNAHPALYWGEDSDFDRPLFSIVTAFTPEGRAIGVTSILGARFNTSGVLGRSTFDGRPAQRAFPGWITIPGAQDLATGRVWHFFFAWLFVANGVVFFVYSLITRHLSRDLLPRRNHWRTIGGTIRNHLTLRLHRGAPAYNVLQQLTYLTVILVLAPLILLTGLAMSPAVAAAAPVLVDVFDGRQSARTVHFILTLLLVLFAVVHLVMIAATGMVNNVRAMTTGWYAVTHQKIEP